MKNSAVLLFAAGLLFPGAGRGVAQRPAPGRLTPLSGFVLAKNETPFAPLYWDRYEQIKPLC